MANANTRQEQPHNLHPPHYERHRKNDLADTDYDGDGATTTHDQFLKNQIFTV